MGLRRLVLELGLLGGLLLHPSAYYANSDVSGRIIGNNGSRHSAVELEKILDADSTKLRRRELEDAIASVYRADVVATYVAHEKETIEVNIPLPDLFGGDLNFSLEFDSPLNYTEGWRGSASAVKSDGDRTYFLTNYHLAHADENIVLLYNGRQVEMELEGLEIKLSRDNQEIPYSAVVESKDKETDLALLSVEASDLKMITKLARDEEVRVADVVYLMGYPLGSDFVVATDGIVGAKNPFFKEHEGLYYTIVASSLPGNSGGPILGLRNGHPVLVALTSAKPVYGFGFNRVLAESYTYGIKCDIIGGFLDKFFGADDNKD